MNQSAVAAPTERVTEFVRFMRAEGFDAGIQETVDCGRLLELFGAIDERRLLCGARSLLCRSREDWERFEELFELYWHPERFRRTEGEDSEERQNPTANRVANVAGVGLGHQLELDPEGENSPEARYDYGGGASRHAGLAHSDFRFLSDRKQMLAMERLAEHLARRLRRRLVRRRRVLRRGRQIHMRKTIRRSLRFGGVPMELSYRVPRRNLPRLLLLLDVSHSMDYYSYLLARFARGTVLAFPDAEAFVFHTELFRVTDLFREQSADVLRQRLEGMSRVWFGGTRIAECLVQFIDDYAGKLVNSRTVVVIMSDGFDTDEPEALEGALGYLRRRARRIVWLNPLLGRTGYDPNRGAMLLAQPYLDLFAPAHSLASLRKVGSYLAAL